jgi:hypothetical protein
MASSEPKPPASRIEVWVVWILGAIVLIALAVVMRPVVIKQHKAAIRTKALGNVRQIGMSLFEFDSEYGRFPDEGTAEEVRNKTKTGLKLSGPHSNDYFRQLIAVGLKSEQPFWCKTSFSPRRPDDDWSASKALEAGEVGYSYIVKAAGAAQSSSEDPARVVVVAPVKLSGSEWSFDWDAYEGRAIVLKLDNSAAAMSIDPATGFIMTGVKGRFIQTTGPGSPWGNVVPELYNPEPSK